MRKFFYIYLFLLALTYVCFSLLGASWNPTEWTYDIRSGAVLFIILDVIAAAFAKIIIFTFED